MTKKDSKSPLWLEGMFLTPQHFQMFERNQNAQSWSMLTAQFPYPWGFSELEIDTESLGTFTIKVNSCTAVMPGGAWLTLPGNLNLPSRSIEGQIEDPSKEFLVYLGLPDYKLDEANLAGEGGSGVIARYSDHEIEIRDENSGQFEQNIKTKRLEGKFFLEGEQTEGYEILPFAKIKAAPNNQGVELVKGYFPPVTSIGAWTPLLHLAQGVAAKFNSTSSCLTEGVEGMELSRVLALSRGTEQILKTVAMNGAKMAINQISKSPQLHPYWLYVELLRVCGLLWAFKGAEKLHEPIPYKHRDLGECFSEIYETLDKLLALMPIQYYDRVRFVVRHGRLEADISSDWITKGRAFYLRPHNWNDPQSTQETFGNLKLCAPSDFQSVIQKRLKALDIKWLSESPNVLPLGHGIYGKIEPDEMYWANVSQELILALGGIDDSSITFDLFVV